jgi:hypothetical protein
VPLIDLKFLNELAADDAGTSNRRYQAALRPNRDNHVGLRRRSPQLIPAPQLKPLKCCAMRAIYEVHFLDDSDPRFLLAETNNL